VLAGTLRDRGPSPLCGFGHSDRARSRPLPREDGSLSGYVDLGELGVADRHWDLAVGGWSVVCNYGEDVEHVLYEAYGLESDPRRIAFYRLLYDLAAWETAGRRTLVRTRPKRRIASPEWWMIEA
jgi:kanamycin kinase